jgi:hypothetical protein
MQAGLHVNLPEWVVTGVGGADTVASSALPGREAGECRIEPAA